MAIFKIGIGALCSVTFALLLSEIRSILAKRVFQTIVYVPNFISWVIMAGVLRNMLATSGPINALITSVGIKPVPFLSDQRVFPWTIILTDVWKTFGFGTVVYLAAITAIDPALFESAVIDGAGRGQQVLHITVPTIAPMIVLVTVLALGNVLSVRFDQVYNMYSPSVYVTGDIIETYVYRLGVQNGKFSIGAAVGLFKSFVSLILVSLSLILANKAANYRVF